MSVNRSLMIIATLTLILLSPCAYAQRVRYYPYVFYRDYGSASGLVVADFNGDGHADVAVTNSYGNSLNILLGNSDGSLGQTMYLRAGTDPGAIAAADVNHDGILDLIVGNKVGQVVILFGNGDGTFTETAKYKTNGYPSSIAVCDLDNDGNLDLAVAQGGPGKITSGVDVLLGSSDGSFLPAVDYQTDIFPQSITCGDLNGDGNRDLVTINDTELGSDDIFMGNGDGTLQSPTLLHAGNFVGTLADINGDGKLDLVSTAKFGDMNLVGAALGNGDGTFQKPTKYSVPGSSEYAVVVADMDGDGKLDILAAPKSHGPTIYFGNGDGTFLDGMTIYIGLGCQYISAGDINGDGKLDIIEALGDSVAVFIAK